MSWIDGNVNKDPMAKVGMRIRMISMEDSRPVDEGMEGVISHIDSLGTLHVNWDDGRTLGVIPGSDEYQLLPPKEDQVGPDDFAGLFGEESDPKPYLKKSKSTEAGKNFNKNLKSALSKVKPKPKGIKVEAENIKGGEAEGMSAKDLAKKHDVSVEDIEKEIKVGIKIEMEHTDSKEKAKEIAMDHIAEFPDYYTNEKYGTIASEKGLEKVNENKSTYTIKDDVGRILEVLKTAKPQHRETIIKMIDNLNNKYKNHNKDEDKFQEIINKLKDKVNTKLGVDETMTAGGGVGLAGASGYAYTPKLESKNYTVGDLLKEISNTSSIKLRDGGSFDGDSWVSKGGWKRRKELAWKGGEISDILAKLNINWSDSDLSLTDKETDAINEGWLIKTKEDRLALEILKRVKANWPNDTRLVYGHRVEFTLPGVERDPKIIVYETNDGVINIKVNGLILDASQWATKKLYKYMYKKLTDWEESREFRKIKADLTDPSYAQDVFNQLGDSETMNEGKKSKDIHTAKWKRCFEKVSKEEDDETAAAICTDSIGYEGSIKKTYRRQEESLEDSEQDIDETTTFASVWGSNGPPVGVAFAAGKGKHGPSKKPIWKGGKIVQKINGGGVLVKEDIMNEINKIKWVKGGKFVKIKDKCAKFNNQPWCDAGNASNPLELSDTTFENVKRVSEKTGLSEEEILERISIFKNGK